MIKRTSNNIISKGFSIAAFLFLLQVSLVQAQYTSRLGKFQVDQIRGCAPFTINITTTNLITVGECTGAKPCNMNFITNIDPSAQVQNLFSYTYTAAGTYKLSVLYQSAGAPDDITITVDPNTQPTFDIYSCSSSGVFINITDKTYDQYFVDFGDGSPIKSLPSGNSVVAQHTYASNATQSISVRGQKLNGAPNCSPMLKAFTPLTTIPIAQINALTAIDKNTLKIDFTPVTNIEYKLEIAVNGSSNFQQYQTLYGVNTVTVSNLNLDNNYYCFRLNAYDPCQGKNNYSSVVCSQVVSLTILSADNKVAWQSDGTGVTGVTVKSVFPSGSASVPNRPFSPSFYDDTNNILCNTQYCYTVIFTYATGATSTSLTKCGQSFITVTPVAIGDVSSVTGTASLDLTWLADPLQNILLKPNTYSILKSIGKAAYGVIGSTNGTTLTYSDATYAAQGNVCYRVDYTDACGNKSPAGVDVCPLYLQGTIDKKNVINLNWSDYKAWKNGVNSFQLDKLSADGTLIKSFSIAAGTLTFTDDQTDLANQIVSYKITAIPNDKGLVSSTSNVITFTKESNLFFPTAFTPNGDNLNDTFTVSGQFIAKMNLSVFDRWGSLLFATEKNEPWTGYYAGKLLSEGAYIWKAEVTDLAGKTFSHTGTIFLITK